MSQDELDDDLNEEGFEDQINSWEEALSPVEESIINNRDRIFRVFEVHFERHNYMVFEEFGEKLEIALDSNKDEEIVDNAITTLLRIIVSVPAVRNELRESGIHQKIVTLLLDLHTEYYQDLQRATNRSYQGKNWWSNLDSEIAIRDGEVGFTHNFTIDYDETIEITTSLTSSLLIANHILRKENEVIENLGDGAIDQIETGAVDSLHANYTEFMNRLIESEESPVSEIEDE